MKRAVICSVIVGILCMSAVTSFAAASDESNQGCTELFLEVASKGLEVVYADADNLTSTQACHYSGTRQADVNYAVISVALKNGSSATLQVKDEDGKLIGENTSDKIALVTHNPKWTGTFNYYVTVDKDSDICFGVFSK